MSELLLEVGCEELPASFVAKALQDLKELLTKGLDDLGIRQSEPVVFATPRRLIVSFPVLAARQQDSEKEQRGPSVKAAFDADNNPTPALLGFCRGQGIEVSELRTEEQYVWFTKKIAGRPTTELLAELLPKAITSLTFEKSMRWGASRLRFARPIRWILATFDDNVIPFEIEGVQSSNLSRGHRFYAPETFEATRLDSLISQLRTKFVEPDVDVRKTLIVEGAGKVATGTPELSAGLIDENSQLTEWPTAVSGSFPEAYLDLPESVLVTAMAKHEKMFPVRSADGKLINEFVFTRNSGVDGDVRRGCEWVLNARFNDAKFFFEQDAKLNFEQFLAKTEDILFQAQLGTVRQRADRLAKLAGEIAFLTGAGADEIEYARQAGLFAKADLASGLVSELSSLQGVIGGEYALREGMPAEVAAAIGSQYDFSSCDPETSAGRTGLILVLADQLDKLAGYLGLGLEPSGSSDPFGLRRAVTYLIEVAWLWKGNLPSYDDLLGVALSIYSEQEVSLDAAAAKKSLGDIFAARYPVLLESTRHDILEAAILRNVPTELANPQRVVVRSLLLTRFIQNPTAVQTATRPMNIVSAATKKGLAFEATTPLELLDPAKLDSPEGTQLFMVLKEQNSVLEGAVATGDIDTIWTLLNVLIDPITRFFDNTMVMAEDESVRFQRLSLCQAASHQLLSAGDFTKLVGV